MKNSQDNVDEFGNCLVPYNLDSKKLIVSRRNISKITNSEICRTVP